MTPTTDQLFGQPEMDRFFTEAASVLASDKAATELNIEELNRFFNSAKRQVEIAEQLNRTEASGFNVFDLIRPDENRLSEVLELLLDPRGAHGQGDLFLRLLMERLNAGLSTKNTKHATVQRNARTHRIERNRRLMDVLVDAGDLVIIENKVTAVEQHQQVKDYLDHLQFCIEDRSIRGTLIYLTPRGGLPGSISREDAKQKKLENRLRCWSYSRDLRAWLEECQRQCMAPRFRNFLSDFIQYIETEIRGKPDDQEEQ